MESTHGVTDGGRSPASSGPTPDSAARDVERFLERFIRFGAAASVETYLPLFHADATLFDDGMERPITVAEIPDSITATLALAQGFVMVPERWRVRERAVFVEARNQATIFGAPASWRSVYRIDLAGDLVLRGRRYYDRAPLLAALDPTLPQLPSLGDAGENGDASAPAIPSCGDAGTSVERLVSLCVRGWQTGAFEGLAALFRDDAVLVAPGAPHPLRRGAVASYRARLASLLRGAVPVPRAWAGDGALVFVEWDASVPTASGAYTLGMVDRFDLVAGRILAARTYFDAAALARTLAST